jgi:alkylation response protein AidB-like acyl-CoA dehydrogenase
MAFFQDPPRLGNQFDDDRLLQDYLERSWSAAGSGVRDELRELGGEAGGRLRELQLADRENEPKLTQWDAWGNRIDRIDVTPLWVEAQKLAAKWGLVATGYEKEHGDKARVLQFLKNYLVDASLDVYSCPLAMTDGAARTLLDLGNDELIDRAVPRLTSRDPDKMWTSGQWMTERTGGSDVGLSETVARNLDGTWRLYGTKWFTSATTSNMTLTLARPEGNGPGGRGLALFYLELRDAAGTWNGIQVNRLKDKLGTRKVPTAELTLDGTVAVPVAGLTDGIRNITPMLAVTRTWNAISAVAGMRRALALATDYAGRRAQFGALLEDKPLHRDTLVGMEAELEGAFLMTFRMIELLGRQEAGVASDAEQRALRLMTPLTKLTTAKQAVAVASEGLECFGGAGYVEDTGLPRILRDAQVLPIWEGTTNVLSLDALRALSKEGTLDAFAAEIEAPRARAALGHARDWLSDSRRDPALVEAGARRFAMTLGRALQFSLLVSYERPTAGRYLSHGIDLVRD